MEKSQFPYFEIMERGRNAEEVMFYSENKYNFLKSLCLDVSMD